MKGMSTAVMTMLIASMAASAHMANQANQTINNTINHSETGIFNSMEELHQAQYLGWICITIVFAIEIFFVIYLFKERIKNRKRGTK